MCANDLVKSREQQSHSFQQKQLESVFVCVSVYAHTGGLQPLGYNNIHRSSLYDVFVYDLAVGDSLYTGQNRANSPHFLNMFENYRGLGALTTARNKQLCPIENDVIASIWLWRNGKCMMPIGILL